MVHFIYERIINDFNISSNLMFVELSSLNAKIKIILPSTRNVWCFVEKKFWVRCYIADPSCKYMSKCDLNSFMLTLCYNIVYFFTYRSPNSFSIHINDLFAMIYEFVFEKHFPMFDNAFVGSSYCAVIFFPGYQIDNFLP